MINKLNLKEGEIQRILSMHKNAILKEKKVSPSNGELLMEETYSIELKKKSGWNSGGLLSKDIITKIKVKNYNKDLVEADVTFGDGGSIDVSFDCTKPDIMVIGGDGQMEGSEYRTDEKLKYLIKWYCEGGPKKVIKDNQSYVTQSKYLYFTEVDIDNELVVFKGTEFKKDPNNEKLLVANVKAKLRGVEKPINSKVYYICSEGKMAIYTNKWRKFYAENQNSKILQSNLQILCNAKSKESVETEEEPTGTDTDGKKNVNNKIDQKNNFQGGETENLRNGTSGNRYTFDFDAVMKAIDDTGVCGVYSGSNNSGINGTGGTGGTSGTGGTGGTGGTSASTGVEGLVIPAPNKNISQEDFTKWTMD